MFGVRTIAALVLAPVLYVASLFGVATLAVELRDAPAPQLTCPEAARVMDAASRSNAVHWAAISCASITKVGPHDWRAKLQIDDGSGTLHDWTADLSLDQYIITNAIQTGTHTIPKG
jgi:hypothetical protein